VKIRIQPAFFVYLSLVGIIDGLSYVLCLLLTLFIHESGHLIAGRVFKETYSLLEITPLGGMLSYKPGCPSRKGLKGVFIAAAGPLFNIVTVYLFVLTPLKRLMPQTTGQAFLYMNACMFLFNILPALPLDGGRIVFCLGYYLFPIAQLGNLLTALGRVTGASGILISIYGFIHIGKLNLSLLAASLYIVLYAEKQKETLYASTLHTVIQERLFAPSIQKMQLIRVNASDPLTGIIPCLCKTDGCVFMLEYGDQAQLLSERQVFQKLLDQPALTFSEAFSII